MSRFVAVAIESDLIQLDRVFDFVVPEALQGEIAFGQRVSLTLGRAKKVHTGFVVALPTDSEFAKTEILGIVDPRPVLTEEILKFSRQVANRQCVSIGEILTAAIPAHMPRSSSESQEQDPQEIKAAELIRFEPPISKRSAVLSSGRAQTFNGQIVPDWALAMLQEASKQLSNGMSVILIVPEESEIRVLEETAQTLGLSSKTILMRPGGKKSEKFQSFHACLENGPALVIGTRSAIYAPVTNLGLIAVFDDADDSLREQGSPFTHARELALMRAGKGINLLLIANYRSVEVQRLVQINYLSDHNIISTPPKISFTPPGARVDEAAFRLIRERLADGTVLVLMPRKGNSAAVFCGGCSERISCKNCRGPAWEPEPGNISCKLCKTPHTSCSECGSSKVRLGRTGSTRTTAELGRAFPNALIAEATGQKKPTGLKPKNQIVVATPGAAPRVPGGYSAVLILDPDVWLSSQSLKAEANAIRDWMEAIELLALDGRAVISGLEAHLGQAISLGQHRELARTQLGELMELGLPPATRIATLEAMAPTIQEALDVVMPLGARALRTNLEEQASALICFSYDNGAAIALALRQIAIKTNARLVGTNKRRGLRVVMDDPEAL